MPLVVPPPIGGLAGTLAPADTLAAVIGDESLAMMNARAHARCTLAELRRRVVAPPATQSRIGLLVRLRESDEHEDLWMTPVAARDGEPMRGILRQVPAIARRFQRGSTIFVGRDDVLDWYAVDQDTMVAGFTLRLRGRRHFDARRDAHDAAGTYVIPDSLAAAVRRCPR